LALVDQVRTWDLFLASQECRNNKCDPGPEHERANLSDDWLNWVKNSSTGPNKKEHSANLNDSTLPGSHRLRLNRRRLGWWIVWVHRYPSSLNQVKYEQARHA
jgi:hypothetical protein